MVIFRRVFKETARRKYALCYKNCRNVGRDCSFPLIRHQCDFHLGALFPQGPRKSPEATSTGDERPPSTPPPSGNWYPEVLSATKKKEKKLREANLETVVIVGMSK